MVRDRVRARLWVRVGVRPREHYLDQVGGEDRVEEGEGGTRGEQRQHHHPARDEERPQRH